MDEMNIVTQNFDSTFVWCQQNDLIRPLPECPYCKIPMRVTINSKNIHDAREYSCHNKCGQTVSIREGSFTDEFKCTLMELVRVIFYYYCRGYSVDTVHKEIANGISRSGGIDMCKQMVHNIFTFVREIISDRVTRDIKKKKLGGPGFEVWMDSYKLNLKTNSGVEEFWIVAFIERETNRSRAYITNDIKVDTIALFIAKTVGRHTTLCTPYYHQVGWEFLDKFYDHQRLKKDKSDLRGAEQEQAERKQQNRHILTGFEYMWAQIKELELVFMKMGEKTRRLRRVKNLLQPYMGEMVWRIECRTLEEKRKYLLKTLCVKEWGKYVRRLEKLQKKQEKVNAKNVAEEMLIELEHEQKKKKRVRRRLGGMGVVDPLLQTNSMPDEEDDPIEERRIMFGEVSSDSDSAEDDEDEDKEKDDKEEGYKSDDSVKAARGGAHGACEEDDDEFMIVMHAVRERKKLEADSGKPLLKDRLSQTGWKVKNNFFKLNNANIDERDRIDVFNGPALQPEKAKKENGQEGADSESEDDVVILDYL